MSRKPINPAGGLLEAAVLLGEGNPGALTVLRDLLADRETAFTILHLEDMNIRGSQIWVAYKDHCKCDLGTFVKACFERDPAMVATVNQECADSGEVAVERGASEVWE